MFILGKFPFWAILGVSELPKVLKWPKQSFSEYYSEWKLQNFMLSLNPLIQLWKKCSHEISYQQRSSKNWLFPHFIKDRRIFGFSHFMVNFSELFQRIWTQHGILLFICPLDWIFEKLLCPFITLGTLKLNVPKWLEKRKTPFLFMS